MSSRRVIAQRFPRNPGGNPQCPLHQDCQVRYPLHRYERLAPLLHRLRITKDPEELKLLQCACDITEAGFRRLLGFIKPGTGEWWWIHRDPCHKFKEGCLTN